MTESSELGAVLASGEVIDCFLNMIPARYYFPEDGVTRKGLQTTTVLAERTKTAKRKRPGSQHVPLSKNQLHEKLLAKIEEMKKNRQSDKKERGKSRQRGKRAVEDVSFAKVMESTTPTPENKAGSKRRKLERDIRDAERVKKKIGNIADVAERTETQNSVRMEKALQRAQGNKIHDDVSKLKKTLKRKTKRREKGKKGWEERVNEEKADFAARQTKRKDNLQKRSKKKKRRNGFEGKPGFLNQDVET